MTVATAGQSGMPVAMWHAIVGLVRRWAVAEFVVPGEPVAWERAGRSRDGRHSYTPAKTRDGEDAIARAFGLARPGWQVDNDSPWGVLVELHVRTLGAIDLDNMIKLIFDGLNGVMWRDDQQVADLLVRVERGVAEPRTVVVVFPAAENRHRVARSRKPAQTPIADDLRRRVYNIIVTEALAGRKPTLTAIGVVVGLSPLKAGDVVRSLEADGYLTRSPTRPYKVKIHKPFSRETST